MCHVGPMLPNEKKLTHSRCYNEKPESIDVTRAG